MRQAVRGAAAWDPPLGIGWSVGCSGVALAQEGSNGRFFAALRLPRAFLRTHHRLRSFIQGPRARGSILRFWNRASRPLGACCCGVGAGGGCGFGSVTAPSARHA